MKKFCSILLIVCLLVSSTAPVFAYTDQADQAEMIDEIVMPVPNASTVLAINGSLSKSFYPGTNKAITFSVTNSGTSTLTFRITPSGTTVSTYYVAVGKTVAVTLVNHSSYSFSASGTGYVTVSY